MSQLDYKLNCMVRDLLLAHRPCGVPTTIPVVIQTDIAKVARPYVVVYCKQGEYLHPMMRKTRLVVRMRTRADEVSGADGALWHAAMCGVVKEKIGLLAAMMQDEKYLIKKMLVGDYSDEDEDERGRVYEQEWVMVVQTIKI